MKEVKGIKKRKGNRIIKGRYFLWLEKLKMLKRQISRFKSKLRKTFRKMPKSSEIQVSRNDPKVLPKINNNI